MTFPDGRTYKGQFVENQFTGQGTLIDRDGGRFSGGFRWRFGRCFGGRGRLGSRCVRRRWSFGGGSTAAASRKGKARKHQKRQQNI